MIITAALDNIRLVFFGQCFDVHDNYPFVISFVLVGTVPIRWYRLDNARNARLFTAGHSYEYFFMLSQQLTAS